MRHPLGHDEVILAHRDLPRVAQLEALPRAQKARLRIGQRHLVLAHLLHLLQLLEHPLPLLLAYLPPRLAVGVVLHLLHPLLHLLLQPLPLHYPVARGVTFDARRVDGHLPHSRQPGSPQHLQHLGEQLHDRSPVHPQKLASALGDSVLVDGL